MRHSGEASKLLLQPIDAGRRGATKGLQRHNLVSHTVVNLVDHAHPAGAQAANHREAVGAGKVVLEASRPRRPRRCSRYPAGLSGGCHRMCGDALTSSEEPLEQGLMLVEDDREIGG
jgi:hypothetical protein